ncbi:MAG: protein kinase [Terriglobia bacterium]
MPLSSGTRLGPYEVIAPLGAGGMGEVYRARDTRLDRSVAIKVLPPHLAENPQLRQRFEREARALSSLSHPHICALYDIGQQDDLHYLVMEYLEGETVAARLEKGPLPPNDVLRYASQLADALDKAHRQGVLHRDLKPGNIMLTKAGARLFDFGLAKPTAAIASAAGLTDSPTASRPLTAEGTIVGTFQYMAPEQLEGKEADARSDIFAFGAVLYEMATGRKAFEGKTQASVIAAIMDREPPPISTLQPLVPPALDRVVKTCLAKDPDERWQTAHDLMLELNWIAEAGSQAGVPAPVVARRKRREWAAWALVALLAVVSGVLGFAYYRTTSTEVRAVRAFVLPPEEATFTSLGFNGGSLALSPDGRRLAFVATTSEGKQLLWVRSLDALAAQPLAGTEGATRPFWSPDSRFLAFFAEGKLKKIDAAGGPPLTLCDAPDGRDGTWNRDGVIVFSPEPTTPLSRVSAAGGEASPLTALDESRRENTHRWAHFLPDGRHFLYLARSPAEGGGGAETAIYIGSLDSKEKKLLLRAAANAAYSSGHLLFVRERTLMAQPFDAGRRELTGDAFPIAENIQFAPGFNEAVFSVSENGILAYQTGAAQGGSQLLWFDRSGKQIGSVGEPAIQFVPRLSPDGRRAAVTIFDPQAGNWDLWLYDLARGLRTRFTFAPSFDGGALWSPDGTHIVFSADRKGQFDLYQKAASGAGSEAVLLESEGAKFAASWSSDGRFIAYDHNDPKGKTKTDLWVLPLSGDRTPVAFRQTEFDETWAQFSPDGRWLAYVSDESGRKEVYVAPFQVGPEGEPSLGQGGKWQVSTAGGDRVRWNRNGKELFYLAPDNKLMVAQVETKGSSFEVGTVRPLFETRPVGQLDWVYDVSRDGQRFLVNTIVAEQATAPITLVVNWTADLPQ